MFFAAWGCCLTSTNLVLHLKFLTLSGVFSDTFGVGSSLNVMCDFRSVASQDIPLENWLSRPDCPSQLPAHQTPAPDPRPWARSSPGSPTEHKAEPKKSESITQYKHE